MDSREISLSILGYEQDLKDSITKIDGLIRLGISMIHVDVMRRPFIPSRDAFDKEAIALIYSKFSSKASLDFHLMAAEPDQPISIIEGVIRNYDERAMTQITIHMEAYRRGTMQAYIAKENDLLNPMTGDTQLDAELMKMNEKSGQEINKTLKHIRENGFMTGIALEPGTSLDNITYDTAIITDTILLMSVQSGAGSQQYMADATGKIIEARTRYPGHKIQVDGGLNDKTVPEAAGAGADSLVIGSYLTNAEDPKLMIDSIRRYLRR